ncbi:MAG: exo-alpha-sialidase [Ruminococcaceae bacterium]|nr:exo-alpha-sialidase [Oscillospiraceae bacterium]
MELLANDFQVIYEVPKGSEKIYAFTPGITVLENGRYVFTNDIGGKNAKTLPEYQELLPHPNQWRGADRFIGKIFTSDDQGKSWQLRANRNFIHARPFEAGGVVYVIGHCADLVIYASYDGGCTWDDGHFLTEGEDWHQSACNVWIEDGYITLVMEQRFLKEGEVHPDGDWGVYKIAPIVMRARLTDDLTKRESWIFSEKVRFCDVVDEEELEWFGVPFFATYRQQNNASETEIAHCVGLLETNIVRIKDPTHYWYDKTGKTFHLFSRCNTNGTGYCVVMKAVLCEEDGKEIIKIMPEKNPSGKKILFLPLPGGQMRFHILWDEATQLFWLLSTQATDSMTRLEFLSEERFHLPYDERDRLQLSFSKNMVDWCFAGLVAKGPSEKQSRHYASMAIDGEDLVIVSRSGDENTESAHNTNLSTFHRVRNFRKLVY